MKKTWLLLALAALAACDQPAPEAAPLPPVVRIERCMILSKLEGANLAKATAIVFVKWPPRGQTSYYVRIALPADQIIEIEIDPRDKDRISDAWIACAGTKG